MTEDILMPFKEFTKEILKIAPKGFIVNSGVTNTGTSGATITFPTPFNSTDYTFFTVGVRDGKYDGYNTYCVYKGSEITVQPTSLPADQRKYFFVKGGGGGSLTGGWPKFSTSSITIYPLSSGGVGTCNMNWVAIGK